MRAFVLLISLLWSGTLFSQPVLPDNMYPDSTHAPFVHGVASGDPTADAVVVWTHVDVDSADFATSVDVDWQVATDSTMNAIVQSGSYTTDSSQDFTVNVDVNGLNANTYYWYQFTTNGSSSVVGRTKTAPVGNVDSLAFGVVSCSSVFSGYFNAYRQLSRNDELEFIVHVGDYIYEFVDEDEEVRVPVPYPERPHNRSEWRAVHAYYHLDPDFRRVRQQHPFVVLWDNHDVVGKDLADTSGSTQAHLEWVPTHLPDASAPNEIYRTLTFGDLMQLTMVDILRFKDSTDVPEADRSILGQTQYDWLTGVLDTTTATWKIHGNQKQMAGFAVPEIPFVDLNALTGSSWDSYDTERDRLLSHITDNEIDNFVMLSGDIHMTFVSDLAVDPQGNNYNAETGAGAAGVEFLPTSISRGNLDELLGSSALAGTFESLALSQNPNTLFFNSTDHGYGIVRLTPDSLVGEVWYCPIMQKSDDQQLGARFVMDVGDNHWRRDIEVSVGEQRGNTVANARLKLSPNPATSRVQLALTAQHSQTARIEVVDIATGKTVYTANEIALVANQTHTQTLDLQALGLAAGSYLVWTQGENFRVWRKLVVR